MNEENKYCRDIYTLKLSNFEDCLVNNNLAALILSGTPSKQELTTAWSNILQEYTEALGNSEFILYRNMYREIEIMNLNMEMIKIAIMALRKNYSPYFCTKLNGLLRLNCKFNVQDPTSYFAELDKCERRIGGLKINFDLKLIEFEQIKKKFDGDGKPIDKNYFTSMLIVISRGLQLGYRLDKSIFVNEYCEYYKQCAEESERMNKANKKYTRK